jgi:hypothetical protein
VVSSLSPHPVPARGRRCQRSDVPAAGRVYGVPTRQTSVGPPSTGLGSRLERGAWLRLCIVWMILGLVACSGAQKKTPQPARSYCFELLDSQDKHPSAIRLPPAEYDFCKNQVLAEVLSPLQRDAGDAD